jgi:hypothetical protein
MKRLAGEVLAAFLCIAFAAGVMQMLWLLAKWMKGPIEPIFVGAGAICYVVDRTARDDEFGSSLTTLR